MRALRWAKLLVLGFWGLAVLTPFAVVAQDTTSSIRGRVVGPDGSPIAGAEIVVLDTRTGSRTVLNSAANGAFNATGLRVGGPYQIRMSSAAGDASEKDVFLILGDVYSVELVAGGTPLEQVTVIGQAQTTPDTAIGPAATFGLTDLALAPSVNRDIKDLIRIDPRIYVDDSFGDGIQCGGANPRFNSLTVDGVRLNDNFGLNSNGYPTERMPFSYDVIDQVAVELAPYDVQYGGFSACNINAVTKSGTNEFHGSVFYDYTDDSLFGDKLEGDPVDLGSFDEKRYGVTVGGPIVPHRLFFLVSYEKLEGADTFDRGPAGSGRANEVAGVSQAQLDEIIRISNEVYGYDPGGLPASLPVEDEKILAKLDWYITNSQRASFTYNYNDGFHVAESDTFSGALELSNHYYERGAELNSYVGQLFSDWTDKFSTEAKFAYAELDNRQLSLAGTDFGEVQITTENPDIPNTRATVFLGADDSRHANKLKYETTTYKLAGNYLLGDHVISGGYEMESYDIFNMFIQEAEGEYRFSSIEAFAAGLPSVAIYENASPSNIKGDAAGQFTYEINTLYLQDEYLFADLGLTLTAGLRYEWYTSGDTPRENAGFTEAYGFSNAQNLDGFSLLQPRLGFNWILMEELELHGGVGLYSGGNPNVWISNNYTNDGVTQIESPGFADPSVSLFDRMHTGEGRPIYDIPQELYDNVANGVGRPGGVNVLDPDFDVPSEWKYALGAVYTSPGGARLMVDYLYTDKQDAAIIRDISRGIAGETADGRPIYSSLNGRSQDFMLTNAQGDSGYSHVLSFGIDKSYDFGLDIAFGYAFTKAKDINPMSSSVAFSNYTGVAAADSERPDLATSNYEIPHRFTLKLVYQRAFFADYLSKFTMFSSYNQGRPYSYVFDNLERSLGESTGADRQLLYMPTGALDPYVVFGSDFDQAAFFEYADANGLTRYAGTTVPRNVFYSDWWTKVDVKFEQELPGFRSRDRASAYLVVENFTNLLNDEWGVQYQATFPQNIRIVDANLDGDGRYVFNRFLAPTTQSRVTDASLWQIRLGLRYEF